jgi:hypothetical protein
MIVLPVHVGGFKALSIVEFRPRIADTDTRLRSDPARLPSASQRSETFQPGNSGMSRRLWEGENLSSDNLTREDFRSRIAGGADLSLRPSLSEVGPRSSQISEPNVRRHLLRKKEQPTAARLNPSRNRKKAEKQWRLECEGRFTQRSWLDSSQQPRFRLTQPGALGLVEAPLPVLRPRAQVAPREQAGRQPA